jgi:cold shock CspA family protein
MVNRRSENGTLHREVVQSAKKGCSFIQPESGGGKDAFAHISALRRSALAL